MTRLEVLKAEKEQIKGLHCLSFGLIDDCIEWYDKEIEAIVIHGADNKFYGQQADDPYQTDMDEAWEQAKAQADGDLISRNAVEKLIRDKIGISITKSAELIYEVRQLISCSIPPEHDGCKGCKYQDKSEDEMPCLECMHNYTDEWKKAPKWIHTEECDEEFPYRCSECNLPSRSNGHRYCSNCGSYMYGEIER